MQRLSDEGLAQFGLATGDGCVCVCMYICVWYVWERELLSECVCAGGEIKENKDDWDYNDDKEPKSICEKRETENVMALFSKVLLYWERTGFFHCTVVLFGKSRLQIILSKNQRALMLHKNSAEL